MMFPENVKTILKTLNKHGEGVIIGGAVRDTLLGIEPKDYDIATNLPSNEVLSLFKGSKYVGESFGVVLTKDGVEIASYRKDKYNPVNGELEGVEFVSTLEEDLGRRDFTINSMGLSENGVIVDPYFGQEDLKIKAVNFVGDPLERIEEDPVRMIRACRFASKIGGYIEDISHNAINKYATKIQRVTNERIRIELLKIMELDNVNIVFEQLQELGLLKYILFPLSNCYGVEHGQFHGENVFDHNLFSCSAVSKNRPLLRISLLLHDIGKPCTKTKDDDDVHFYNHEEVGEKLAKDLLTTLKFSNKEIKYVCGIIRSHMFQFDKNVKNSTLKRFMAKLADLNIPVEDIMRARIADRRGNLAKAELPRYTFMFKYILKKIRKIQIEEQALKVTDLAIGGKDLIELGLVPGPLFSEILNDCLNQVIDEKINNTKEELIEFVLGIKDGV